VPAALFVTFSIVCFLLPPASLGFGARHWRGVLEHARYTFHWGGEGSFAVALLLLVLSPTLALLGAWRSRGAHVPGGLLLALALLPAGVGLVTAHDRLSSAIEALFGEAGAPLERVPEMAGELEGLTGRLTLGGCSSACLAWTVAAAAVLAIARSPAARTLQPSRTVWWPGAGCGVAAAVASVVAHASLGVPFTGFDALVLAGLIGSGIVVAGCAPTLGARGTWRSLALAASAMTVATALLDRASAALLIAPSLFADSRMFLDATERVNILRGAALSSGRAPVVAAVDAVGVLLCFLPTLAMASTGRGKLSGWALAAAFAGVSVAGLAVALSVRQARAIDALLPDFAALEPPGVALPVVPAGLAARAPDPLRVLIVRRGGSAEQINLRPGYSRVASVVSDGGLAFDSWLTTVIDKNACKGDLCPVEVIATPDPRVDFRGAGALRGLAGTDLAAFHALVDTRPPAARGRVADGTAPTWLGVLDDGVDARILLVVGTPPVRVPASGDVVRVSLGSMATAREERQRLLMDLYRQHDEAWRILLAPARNADVSRLVALLAALAVPVLEPNGLDGRRRPMDVVLTSDRGGLEAAAIASP
jgi:hypothetical protein